MDCISGWSPFSSATITISNDYADKMLCAEDLYAHIHNHRSLLDIEIVSLKRPVTIKGSWLAVTKLEIHLKNLFNGATQNDSEEASSTDSDLNFDLVFANFKANMKLKKRQCVSTEEQSQIYTSDLSNQTLQTEAKVLITSNDTGLNKEDTREELFDQTMLCTSGSVCQQIPEPNPHNQLMCCKHQSCSQKHCHKNVSEISIPNPVVVCQPSDFFHDELLSYNTYIEKPNFKDVQKIFNAIFTTETIQKFKMGASRNEECNVIFKAIDKADNFQGSKMNSDTECMNGNTEKSVPKCGHAKRYTGKRASTNRKEKRGTYITEMSRSRKRGSPLKRRKIKESNINVQNNNKEEFHNLEEISEEVNANKTILHECHSCDACNFVTSKKTYLKMHKKRVHSLKHFKCLYCSKEFAIEKDLRKHLKCHNDAKNCCDICGKMYKDKRKLQAHKITHSEDYVKPEFPCKFCNKSFTDKYVLAYHIKRDHLGMKKSFACPTCGKTFTQKGSYSQHHANVHLGIKPFVCDICKKSFAYGKSLKEHKSMHNEKKLFKCPICAKSFQQSSGLCAHRKTHRSSKDYVCSSCGRGFSQKHALVRHERIHFGEKPFECTLCSKLFSDDSVLRRHMISVHKKDATCWRTDTVTHSQRQPDAKGKR